MTGVWGWTSGLGLHGPWGERLPEQGPLEGGAAESVRAVPCAGQPRGLNPACVHLVASGRLLEADSRSGHRTAPGSAALANGCGRLCLLSGLCS